MLEILFICRSLNKVCITVIQLDIIGVMALVQPLKSKVAIKR